jgi:hypothetical protein
MSELRKGDLGKVGGRMKSGVLNFGWIPPDQRNHQQEAAHALAVAQMPRFQIVGSSDYGEGKVLLTELWKHPAVVDAIGYEYPGTKQFSGCCVGAGGGNALFTLIAADAITRSQPEEIAIPHWLLPYGRSRFYMGEPTPGEGSLGGTFAQAVREDGTVKATDPGLPEFRNGDGLEWGEETEISWSDGDARQTLDLLEHSRKFLVGTTAECSSADNVRDAIVNGYPVTIASNWGGLMKCPTEGDPPVLLNRRSGSWAHQMSVHNWYDHPTLGEIFWIQNQWGKNTHGTDPAGGPGGGFWVKSADIDFICRNGEVFAFSGFNGFPARQVAWDWSRF